MQNSLKIHLSLVKSKLNGFGVMSHAITHFPSNTVTCITIFKHITKVQDLADLHFLGLA